MFIVLFGIQGSGKGTQGDLLARRLNIPHLSTGELLRSIALEPTDEGRRIKEVIERGQLLPDEEMITILKRHLPKHVLLDGFPRTLAQARTLDTFENVDVVLSFELDEAEAMRRALARGRADDTEDAIRYRIKQYHAAADVILEHYKAQGKLIAIDAARPIPIIFDDVCARLKI